MEQTIYIQGELKLTLVESDQGEQIVSLYDRGQFVQGVAIDGDDHAHEATKLGYRWLDSLDRGSRDRDPWRYSGIENFWYNSHKR